jgi:hypothetical protein
MNTFTVTAPVAGYNGESCGVVFKDGVSKVTDGTKEGRAAIEYFRRRGYTLTPEGDDEAEAADPRTDDDGDELFDPSKHDASEVLAYLDAHSEDTDETARVLEAEQAGKARKTILQKGTAA